jgi:succinate dehydrogenase / fumarate reductase membrane anchor subunit
VGAIIAAVWFAALMIGPDAYGPVMILLGSWAGKVVMFGLTASVFYHLAAGLRHLVSGRRCRLQPAYRQHDRGRCDGLCPRRQHRGLGPGHPDGSRPVSSDTDFRTPLGRARGLGSAHHGVSAFIVERSTSVALVPLCLWAVYAAIKVAPLGYEQRGADAAPAGERHHVAAAGRRVLPAHAGRPARGHRGLCATPAAKIAALLANSALCWLLWAVATFSILRSPSSAAGL